MNISKHITYEEATKSQTAVRKNINNSPSAEIIRRMEIVAEVCFEPIREWYGKPLRISSFYRSEELNKKIGGSKTSQHVKGEAIDIDTGSRTENKKLFDWCKANLVYDQLIWEKGDETGPEWIHISFRKGNNRNQTFKK